jgi:hypothetical protein
MLGSEALLLVMVDKSSALYFTQAATNIQEDSLERFAFLLSATFKRGAIRFSFRKRLFRESGIKRVLFQYS